MAAVPVETGTRGKMAVFLHWSCEDVATWIESLGYPQYKLCFTENFIDGKKLLYVNCHYLPRLGITDFEHMKDVSWHVRQLLDINEPQWNRSIALPRRDDMGLFLEWKSQTGVRADSLTYTQFLGTEKKTKPSLSSFHLKYSKSTQTTEDGESLMGHFQLRVRPKKLH